jgi:hypothetical protein
MKHLITEVRESISFAKDQWRVDVRVGVGFNRTVTTVLAASISQAPSGSTENSGARFVME